MLVNYVQQVNRLLDCISDTTIRCMTDLLLQAKERGSAVYVAGNGGSYSNASHCVLHLREAGLHAVDLMADSSHLTALSNDSDYIVAMSKRLALDAKARDVLIVISGSGSSPNIVMALVQAKAKQMGAIGLLGFGGGMAVGLCDVAVVLDSTAYGPIEDCHSTIIHVLKDSLLGPRYDSATTAL